MSANESKWTIVKREIRTWDNARLLKLLSDLYKRSEENRHFIDARVLRGNREIEPFIRRIDEALFPDVNTTADPDLETARKAINDYRRATQDPIGVVLLQLRYVEVGSAFVGEYGGMSDRLFNSFTKMFEGALAGIVALGENDVAPMAKRAFDVLAGVKPVGWWYTETLEDLAVEYLSDFLD